LQEQIQPSKICDQDLTRQEILLSYISKIARNKWRHLVATTLITTLFSFFLLYAYYPSFSGSIKLYPLTSQNSEYSGLKVQDWVEISNFLPILAKSKASLEDNSNVHIYNQISNERKWLDHVGIKSSKRYDKSTKSEYEAIDYIQISFDGHGVSSVEHGLNEVLQFIFDFSPVYRFKKILAYYNNSIAIEPAELKAKISLLERKIAETKLEITELKKIIRLDNNLYKNDPQIVNLDASNEKYLPIGNLIRSKEVFIQDMISDIKKSEVDIIKLEMLKKYMQGTVSIEFDKLTSAEIYQKLVENTDVLDSFNNKDPIIVNQLKDKITLDLTLAYKSLGVDHFIKSDIQMLKKSILGYALIFGLMSATLLLVFYSTLELLNLRRKIFYE